jgi:hypothetical protein
MNADTDLRQCGSSKRQRVDTIDIFTLGDQIKSGKDLREHLQKLKEMYDHTGTYCVQPPNIDNALNVVKDVKTQEENTRRLLEAQYQEVVSKIRDSGDGWEAVQLWVQSMSPVQEYLEDSDEDSDDDASEGEGSMSVENVVYNMYKLFGNCPPLQQDTTFLHSVKFLVDVPILGVMALQKCKDNIGKGHLNASFMSTSIAPITEYFRSPLSNFYDHNFDCCMCAITVSAGIRVLPIVLTPELAMIKETYNSFAEEKEVILPPGIVLVFQGRKSVDIPLENAGSKRVRVFFYRAVLPNNCA